ncbi:MAG: hypothetical protein WC023_00200 [Rhodocyclaceae bacterium]
MADRLAIAMTAPLIGRRTFLKVGLAGSLMLASVGRVGAATADEEAALLAAISAALLAGMLPAAASARTQALNDTVAGVRHAVAGLSPSTQKEIAELFSLLGFPLARRFLAGVSAPWAEARTEDVAAFLENWRHSRYSLLQTAYGALHDLVLGAWYARPEHWAAIGYPGTPEIF